MNNIPKGCKPFNLQECMAGKPVVTRDGRPYKFAGYNPDALEYSKILGWVDGIAAYHSEDGSYLGNKLDDHNTDIFMKAETKTVYHAVIKNEGGIFYTTCLYDSIAELDKIISSAYTLSQIIKIHETEVEI